MAIVDIKTLGSLILATVDSDPSLGLDLPVGSYAFMIDGSGTYYKTNSPSTSWSGAQIGNTDLSTTVSGTLSINNGGTGQTTANGSLNALLPSQTGNSGKYLRTNGTNASWVSVSNEGAVTSFSAGDLSPLFTTSVANRTSTPSLSFSLSNSAANTWFGNNTGSSANPSYNSAGALTKTDDTNVTLTLGGAPTTALLNATSLTLGWTGQLSISRGGTGQSTKTAAFDGLSPSTTKGDLTVFNATNNVRLGVGSNGQFLIADSTQTNGIKWGSNASAQSSPTDPSTTTSTVGVMMGLGGSITPSSTGNIIIHISGDIDNNTAGDGSQVQIRTGTGTAPVNGASLTGTTRGGLVKMLNVNGIGLTVGKVPFHLNAIITGLTVGTAVWIDVGLASITGGTSRIRDISISAHEF